MIFQPLNWYRENYSIVQSQTRNINQLHYPLIALVVGRYEGLFTRRSHISRGRNFISPYNKGHKLFIIPKLNTQQTIFKNYFNILFNLNSYLCWWLHWSYPKLFVYFLWRSPMWHVEAGYMKFCLPDMWRFFTNHRHSYIYEV